MRLICAAAICIGLVFTSRAHAEEITFTESDTASGSLGATPFTDEPITIVVTADPADVQVVSAGYDELLAESATVDVGGIGVADFTDVVRVFSYQPNHAVGVSDVTDGGSDILDIENTALDTYALNTSIGPVTGTGLTNFGTAFEFATSDGNLTFSSLGTSASFEATESAAPEPSTIWLLLAGGPVLWFAIRQRQAAKLA